MMDFMLQMSTDEYSFQTAQTWVGFETQSQNKETILDNRALSFNVSCQSEASEDFPLTGSCFETGPAREKENQSLCSSGEKKKKKTICLKSSALAS